MKNYFHILNHFSFNLKPVSYTHLDVYKRQVRWIYERYLAGASTRMLRDELHEQGVTYSEKSPQWTLPHIKSLSLIHISSP